MQALQVLVVEDDPPSLSFFAQSIQQDTRLALAGQASSVQEARRWLDGDHPPLDVLLIDIGLPDGSGIDVIRYALQREPRCEALVITMFGDDENILACIEAGALGYIHKDSAPEDVAAVIVDMKQGGSPMSPMIARRVLARINGNQERSRLSSASATAASGMRALSPREQEVLELIARGFSYGDIARLKGIGVTTVQTHVKNLYAKLAVKSRGEAVYEASQLGLLHLPKQV
ncbi:response regulator transcription factor [Ramlibacter solisilvae]|nr:response regulator transcription factor [Ramlibacter tataouinensis]